MAIIVRADVPYYATYYGSNRNLVRKSNNELWCCYTFYNAITGQNEVHCSYSTDNGVTWTHEIAVSDPIDGYLHPTLAVDSEDNLHLTYTHWVDAIHAYYLEYRKRTGAGWSSPEIIETDSAFWGGSAIAIDSSNNVHVAWGLSPGGLRYREKIGANWQPIESPLCPGSCNGGGISIAIDSSDNIHIAYAAMGAEGVPVAIYYISKTAGVWGIAQEITPAHNQAEPSIAVDSSGNVHVAWWGPAVNSKIYYGYRDVATGIWTCGELGSGKYPSIAIDVNGIPQILLASSNLLVRVWKTDGGWDWETIMCPNTNYYPSALWAMWPMVGGVRTNVLNGFAVAWTCGSSYDLLYYGVFSPLPTLIIKEYTLVQQELLELLEV